MVNFNLHNKNLAKNLFFVSIFSFDNYELLNTSVLIDDTINVETGGR